MCVCARCRPRRRTGFFYTRQMACGLSWSCAPRQALSGSLAAVCGFASLCVPVACRSTKRPGGIAPWVHLAFLPVVLTLSGKKTCCLLLWLISAAFLDEALSAHASAIVVRRHAKKGSAAQRNPGRHGCWRRQCAAFLTQFLTCCLRPACISRAMV